MSGLGDAHTHFTWNNGDLNALGGLGVEEHTLLTAKAAKTYLDSGYTMWVLLILLGLLSFLVLQVQDQNKWQFLSRDPFNNATTKAMFRNLQLAYLIFFKHSFHY